MEELSQNYLYYVCWQTLALVDHAIEHAGHIVLNVLAQIVSRRRENIETGLEQIEYQPVCGRHFCEQDYAFDL